MNSKHGIIIEKPVIQEAVIEKIGKSGKARCKVILQFLNTPGINGREYPEKIIYEQLEVKREFMEKNVFLGELDHPIDDDPIRNSIVMLERSSHSILEAYIEDNAVRGVIETLSTRCGKDLYNLIAVDRLPVGFSLRALGDHVYIEGRYVVTRMTMITYDAVANPSFREARVQEVSLSEMAKLIDEIKTRPENKVLLESSTPAVCIGGKCYLVEHIDKVINETVKKVLYDILWGF